jgi:type II secretory pathway component GspD/PulD (secretin)
VKRLIFIFFITFIFAQEELSPESLKEETAKAEPRVTNVFYESELTQVLKEISDQVGIPIITDGTVSGQVTMEIKDLPLEECLKRILFPLGFSFKKLDNYYLVGSGKPDYPSFSLLSTCEIIRPNYLKAKDIFSLLSDFYKPYVKINEKINALVITAPNQIIEKFKEDLKNIDKPPRQVLIEALVTEISTDALKELGINWSGKLFKGADTFNIFANFSELLDTTFGIIYKVVTKELGKGWFYSFLPTLEAMVEKGKATVKANPKLVTIEGQEASITVGKEQYYQMVTGPPQYPYVRLEVVKFGTSLNITPFISDKDEITVEIEPEVSDFVGRGVGDLPLISRRGVKTQIRVKDGEKIVIGGLLTKNERVIQRKVPLLGDIPILGFFFRYNRKVTDNSEVVIIITPHILK